MRTTRLLLALLAFGLSAHASGAELRGDAAAIADARGMVEAMGGAAIWGRLESVHFVHEWDFWNRPDRYLENEILDLGASRSWITMKSEIYDRLRAYSPEHGYWNVVNGEFACADRASFDAAMERAPYSLYRIARSVARGDAAFEVRHGPMKDMPQERALQFVGPDGEVHGWILLNTRKEPVVWATTQYAYELGPLRRFGNLLVPDWATTGAGRVRYQMVSLTGSSEPVDPALFVPPREHGGAGRCRP